MSTDRFVIRVVVVALAVGVIGGLCAMSFLAFTSTTIPDQLDRLVTFLSGGLAGILVKTSTTDEPVQVEGQHGGPVEVEEVSNPKKK